MTKVSGTAMEHHLLSMWVLLCTCLLLAPSWFGNNGVKARSSRPPKVVGRDETEKCLSSPGYPDTYPDNSHIRQPLSVAAGQSIQITFQDFDVEYYENTCPYDYVEFYDENGNLVDERLCGNSLPAKLTILTSTASVLFHSDESVTKKGFKFCYKPGNINDKCLTSPGYPDHYSDNSNIRQPLSVPAGQSIEIIFQDFDVEDHGNTCPYDYVEFYDENGNLVDERLCGNSLPAKLTILTSTASVLFHSDESVTKKGFKFCYKPGSGSTVPECGIENHGTRIIGGSITAPNQYPWMVRLPMGCGGSLITDRHVLTAKHCVDERTQFDWRGQMVKVSVHNQSDPNDYKEVMIKDYVWPDFSDSGVHDIAIVILDPPVDLNDKTIGTVCLPPNANEDYRGKKAMAMGWGWTPIMSPPTALWHGRPSQLLQHLELTVSQIERKNFLYTQTQLIDGLPLDVCNGDSGGPLAYKEAGRWIVIATVSGGDKCFNHTGAVGDWNKVTDHLPWIRRIIDN